MARRILEIGPVPIVKTVLPDETIYAATGAAPLAAPDETTFDVSLARLSQLRRLLNEPALDAIFVTKPSVVDDPLTLRGLSRRLFSRHLMTRGVPLVRQAGDRILHLGHRAPLIVHDPEDTPFAAPGVLWLWRRADVVFKRELPPDHWRLFTRTAHRALPTPRFRALPRYQGLVDKLRPISLGIRPEVEAAAPREPVEKQADVFFAGTVAHNSTVRMQGQAELDRLAAEGFRIDRPADRLPQAEFLRRCAAAWLVWSPEGLGWDCFRHYETALCGSVPLTNWPTILRHRPLEAERHAIYYPPEPGGLAAAARAALADRPRLLAMGQAARAHVLQHQTRRALVEHMLAFRTAPSGPAGT